MRSSLFSGTALAFGGALLMWSCGGSSSPAAPSSTTPPPPAGAAVTVTISSATGPASFSPNPVPATSGDTVVFKNNDSANTHHIVMDDGSADLGSLEPGQTSKAVTVKGGANFHCANHPWMVGAINQAVPDAPPCTAGPGYC
jgi:plastocyanin